MHLHYLHHSHSLIILILLFLFALLVNANISTHWFHRTNGLSGFACSLNQGVDFYIRILQTDLISSISLWCHAYHQYLQLDTHIIATYHMQLCHIVTMSTNLGPLSILPACSILVLQGNSIYDVYTVEPL